MTEHRILSMQESTTGYVERFLTSEGCNCLNCIRLLSYLAGALQRYEEEGVLLSPRVILSTDIEQFARSIPGGRFVIVGTAEFASDVGKKLLKQCATLATAGWVIFAERAVDGRTIKLVFFPF